MAQPKLWTKEFITGTCINFLLILNYYLLMVIMANYSSEQYHVTASSAGLSASMFVIGALLARFFSAQLMEKLGKKRLLLLGGVVEVIASALYFVAAQFVVLLAIRVLHGLSYGMASTSISTVITGTVPDARRGEGIGYFMLSITVGAAIGPFLGIFLIEHGGYFSIFMTCVVTAVLGLGGALLMRIQPEEPAPSPQEISPKAKPERGLRNLFERTAVPISFVCAGIYFCYSGIISFLASYAAEIQLQAAATVFFVVYSLVILVTRPFTGRMFDQRGERFVMLPAFCSFFVGMILLSQARNGVVLLLSAALVGFGIGVIQSSGLAIAVKKSVPERISYVNSTFYVFIDCGTGIGPFVLGFLIPVLGYRGMYLAMAGVTVLFCLLYLVVSREGKDKGK